MKNPAHQKGGEITPQILHDTEFVLALLSTYGRIAGLFQEQRALTF